MLTKILSVLSIFTILFIVFTPCSNAINYDFSSTTSAYLFPYSSSYYTRTYLDYTEEGYYYFNSGNNQGWTFEIRGSSTSTVLLSERPTGWYDANNYPNEPFTDPIGNSRGSACKGWIYTPSWPSGIGYAVVCFKSPDLSTKTAWQRMDDFSCQLASSICHRTFTSLHVKVEDQNGIEHEFYNGAAVSNINGEWKKHTFSNLSYAIDAADPPITSYTVKQVIVKVWIPWPTFGGLGGTICLDNVLPGN